MYKGFSLSREVQYNILQFVDDTILFGESSLENLWSLKVVFRGFELVSGLSINLSKTKIYAVGCSHIFLDAAASFLGCMVDKFPFKFLGFIIGGNQRNISFWNPVIDSLKAKLAG